MTDFAGLLSRSDWLRRWLRFVHYLFPKSARAHRRKNENQRVRSAEGDTAGLGPSSLNQIFS